MEKRLRHFDVLINEEGMRLDEFLAYKIARLSRSQAQAIIKGGGVSLSPFRRIKSSLRVQYGDSIVLSQTMIGDVGQYDEVSLIAETDAFWCFSKPAGMTVHPTAKIYHNTITRYVEVVLGATPYVVHRLDKESSGLLIVAKSPSVSKDLGALFLDQALRRNYFAVVYDRHGKYYPGYQGEIDIPLGLSGLLLPHITMGMGDLPALSEFECLASRGKLALLKLGLRTGRQHQLRVHLALTGTPIVGDKLYFFGETFYRDYLDGKEVPAFAPHRQLLHATGLCFSYGGETYEYEEGMPELFESVFSQEIAPNLLLPTGYSKLF